jgi:hypothetical protein
MSLASGNGRPVLGPKPNDAAAASEKDPSICKVSCVVIVICLLGEERGVSGRDLAAELAGGGHVPCIDPGTDIGGCDD